MTVRCVDCRYWSDLAARIEIGPGDARILKAVCLNEESERYGDYTAEAEGCASGSEGTPIDLECDQQ